MIQPDFQAVIFDCDGTLVDSEPITVQVLVEYALEFGLEIDHEEALMLFVGRDMPGITKFLESRTGAPLPADFCEEFRRRQAVSLRRELKPIDGAHELLKAMTRPFCLASNAPQDKIEINLTVTRLDRFFTKNRTFSAYDISAWKPQPDLFLHAAEKMQCQPSRCVVIEDSIAGIEAGLAAGMQVIGYSSDEDRKVSTEVPMIHSLIDLIDVLA
jgi:HAD superfamily hydrolase (TIGR01509 family)